MFGNLGLHVMQFPSKKWGFVGTIPTTLAKEVPATTADVLGCCTHKGCDGATMAWKLPVFDTEQEARDFASLNGAEVSQ